MQGLLFKDGKIKERLKSVYRHIIERCYDKNSIKYQNYGGRGIKVDDEWLGVDGFSNFYEWSIKSGFKNKPNSFGLNTCTIDRIDNDGNYSPKNCRWVDAYIQNNNRRNNVFLTYNGETKTITQWARYFDKDPAVFRRRLSLGWDIEKVISKPSKPFIQRKTPSRKKKSSIIATP